MNKTKTLENTHSKDFEYIKLVTYRNISNKEKSLQLTYSNPYTRQMKVHKEINVTFTSFRMVTSILTDTKTISVRQRQT